ncbi:MAG: hypothetical protein KKB62_03415 [Nanoarchaeota archaeon]|nr:hypothetical protein [Nanoarchaeota archaeon]
MNSGKTVYLVGAFTNPDWREEFIRRFPKIKWIDPKDNPQSSMAKAVFTDLESSIKSNFTLCYIPSGKKSAGTTSYIELGVARTKGKAIIAVDESGTGEKEKILYGISSYYFSGKEDSFNALEKEILFSKYEKVNCENSPTEKDSYENVYFAGDIEDLTPHMVRLKNKGKKINCGLDVKNLDEFKETDLMITNFKKRGNYGRKDALFFMGVSYALDIPIILVDENPVNYPTLPAVARRTFHKENRFDELSYYLDRLESLKINEEALVYYNLMNNFNK